MVSLELLRGRGVESAKGCDWEASDNNGILSAGKQASCLSMGLHMLAVA